MARYVFLYRLELDIHNIVKDYRLMVLIVSWVPGAKSATYDFLVEYQNTDRRQRDVVAV